METPIPENESPANTAPLEDPIEANFHLMNNSHTTLNLINQIANVQRVNGAEINEVVSGDNAPGSIMVSVNEVSNLTSVLNRCIEKQILPTFVVETEEETQNLIDLLKSTKLKDANVISSNRKLLAKIRFAIPTVRTGLIIDIDGTLTEKTANDLRIQIRQAPATFCVINSEDASHVNVDELQEMAIAVWVNVTAHADSTEFIVEALRAVTSGANGVITESSAKLTQVINTYLEENSLTKTPIMIGHRGNPGVAPENSLSGFLKAYENGADVIEIDVEVTKDGEIIIMHDDSIKRTTTYSGDKLIGQMTLEEIKAEFIREKSGDPSDEKVPTLKELLEAFEDKDCKIFVEFKGNNVQNIPKTCVILRTYDMVHKVDVISFNTSFLVQTTGLDNIPGMSTGHLQSIKGDASTAEGALAALYNSLKVTQAVKSTINPDKAIVTDAFLQAAADRGMTVWPWTYNASNNDAGFLSGCDGVTTDDMQWVTDMVKYLTVAENINISVGSTAEHGVKTVTYGDTEAEVAGNQLIVKILAGGDCVQFENGTITGIKDGVATVMYGYAATTTDGTPYVVYTQPVTVTVG